MPFNLMKSSSCSSLHSLNSTTSISLPVSSSNAVDLDHGTKRVTDLSTDMLTRPLKRSKPALSTASSLAVSDMDEDCDSTLSTAASGPKTSKSQEVIEIDSDRDELEKDLGACIVLFFRAHSFISCLAAAQKTWRSPIYSFFKSTVTIEVHKNRVSHFFRCAAKKCKTDSKGVRRYLDKGDKSSTANLRHHAIRCFGEDSVNAAVNGDAVTSRSGNIFSIFARQGQNPVSFSHRAHTNTEFR